MNAPLPSNFKFDMQGLISAIAHTSAEDQLANALTPAHWETFAPYLQPVALTQSQVLFSRGDMDRTLYFIESGSLSVHYEDSKGRVRLGIVSAGSVIGEAGFFSHQARTATVQAGSACKLWGLTALRFSELANRQPEIALGVAMACGAVMAKRLSNRRRRIVAT
jgi:CRP/FNR family transcriptional regulator, cyclic AMP receptor protein